MIVQRQNSAYDRAHCFSAPKPLALASFFYIRFERPAPTGGRGELFRQTAPPAIGQTGRGF